MEQLNIKHECKRYGCAVLAATVFAINIKTFVRAGGLYPGGVSGLTLLIQNIFAQFLGLQIPYTVINILLNSIPVYGREPGTIAVDKRQANARAGIFFLFAISFLLL